MQCAFLPIPFPLSSCSLDAFFLRGESRTADPLASCPSPNRCLPRLSEERDGWTLSDISDRPMRSQASAAAPMGVRRRARFPGEPGGPGWSSSRRRVFCAHVAGCGSSDSPRLRWRRRSPARASPGRRARAPPVSRRGAAPGGSGSGAGAAHAPRRGARRWASRRGEIGPRGRGRRDHGPETRGAGCLRRGVFLRQSAGEIPALLFQHALLGESWGSRRHLGCRAPAEGGVGCPRLRRGVLRCPVQGERGERHCLVFWNYGTLG